MKNRDVFTKDPNDLVLLNDGVAKVTSERNEDEDKKLRFELETFVCEGQYAKGLDRILRSYLDNLKKPEQPAVWVSGFFGSGKSHLVKMLQALWVDLKFSDEATARGIADLSPDIEDHLKNLSIEGKRIGGLHTAAGTLGSGAGDSVRLALLAIVFKSAGLPEEYAKARFVIFLKNEGLLEGVKSRVEAAGKNFVRELANLYVSDTLAQAILKERLTFATSAAEVKSLLKVQFPNKAEVTDDEMHESMILAIGVNGKLPCTLIVLDEVQQYIGDSADRTYRVQEVTESCSKKFGGRLLFVATGQSALSGTPQLQKLMARFQRTIELADNDVEAVIRKMVLEKKADKKKTVETILDSCSGELSRHLNGTKIGPRTEDNDFLVSDYPLLPVRRRFWEWVLRQVDRAGTSAQLRTQLRIVYEAVRSSSNDEVGHVVPGDYIFDQIASVMVQTGVLMKEIHELIKKQDDGTPDGKMRYRLCSLIFLIGKLPREGTSDLGIRATPDVLADLLITDLKTGSAELRKRIPELLARLLTLGHLMPVGAEFRIQTREGGEWDSDYRGRLQKISNDDNRVAGERTDLLRAHCYEMFKEIKLVQGKSKVARRIELHFTPDAPPTTGEAIPVWVRNGWIDDEKSVLADARKAGTSSPLISVLIPRRSAEDLKKALCSFRAASETLDARGVPSGPEGIEARTAMDTRRTLAEGELKAVVHEIMDGIRVFMGGGNEISALNPVEAVKDAALAALARHFPNFNMADDPKWDNVCDRAKEGGGNALEALGYKGNAADHPVCKAVLGYLGANKKGIDIRKNFEDSPYGWSRDAVDGAILTLCLNDLVEARDKSGTVLDHKQLDRTKIGICDFKPVTVLITAPQKIAIKKLFQELPVSCKPGEESAAAGVYCREMLGLAESAGGEAPLPERPNTRHIFELQGLSGNEQLFALYNQRDALAQQATAWKARKAGIEKRLPGWKSLERLLSHSTGLAVAAEVQPQRDAILDGRALLEDPDPVPGLCKKLSDELRKTLLAARAEFDNARAKAMDAVDESPDAAKVGAEVKDLFIEKCALRPAPALKVGTGDELLRELEECSPSVWKTRTDALPTRFQQLQLLIAKAIAPDAVPVKLPAATLYTEKDVDAWLAAVKDEILKVLKNGPVVIS